MTSFDGVSFYLREKFQLLRYDSRGQGKSPKPHSVYTLNDHVNDLRNLLINLDLGKVILIGLSNGGRIALEYARLFESDVCAVVACDTYDVLTPILKAKLGSWLSAYEIGGGAHRFDIASPWIWGEEAFNEKSELLLSYRSLASEIPSHVVHGLILGALQTDIDISKINRPILFLVGNEDLLTPPFIHEKMKNKAKNAELKITPGGHASLIERPMIAEDFIVPWIEGLV